MNASNLYFEKLKELSVSTDTDQLVNLRYDSLFPHDLEVDTELEDVHQFREDFWNDVKALRSNFWNLSSSERDDLINKVESCPLPEIESIGIHFRNVNQHFSQYQTFRSDDFFPKEFRENLLKMAISNQPKACQIRAKEFNRLFQDQNQNPEAVYRFFIGLIDRIQLEYPGIYQMEMAWFDEFEHYLPKLDMDYSPLEGRQKLISAIYLVLTIFICISLMKLVFSL